jgi:uncharacterized protein (DUF1697 family)
MPRYAALLRAVNVGGRKVTMAELKKAAAKLGFGNPRTLIASGNLVFDTKKTTPAKLETALEAMIEKTFGLVSEVMVRDPAEWSAIIKANPLKKKAREDPAHLVCVICKGSPDRAALNAYLTALREKYDKGEQVEVVGREIYIDYGDSIGQSKLVLPKKVCTGTARNWNTMLKLAEILAE